MPPKNKKQAAGSVPPAPTTPPPKWPHMQPLLHPSDLALTEAVPNQIYTIHNLWTSTLCKNYVSFLSSLPLTTTPGKPKKGDAVRVNDRFQVDDPVFAESLWSGTALKSLVMGEGLDGERDEGIGEAERRELWGGDVVGLNSNIRVYRYKKGQFFDQHYDESNTVTIPSSAAGPAIPARTTWTLLLYLTSPATGCVGGETVFYPDPPRGKKDKSPEPVVVDLEVGMALLHKHGRDCMLHEGREVIEGEKWVIRSDLCVKR